MKNTNTIKSNKTSFTIVLFSLSIALLFSSGLSLGEFLEHSETKSVAPSYKPKQLNYSNPTSSGLFWHPVKCGSWPMYNIENNKIIYLTPTGELIIRSTQSGQVLFALLPDEPPFEKFKYNLEISVHGQYVIYPYHTNRTVYCVDIDNQKLVWQKKIEAEINDYAGCFVLKDHVFIRCVDESVCLDLKTGTLVNINHYGTSFMLNGDLEVDEDLDIVYYKNSLNQITRYKNTRVLLKNGQTGTMIDKDFVILDKTLLFRTKNLAEKPIWTIDIANLGFDVLSTNTRIINNKLYIYNHSSKALINLVTGKPIWCKGMTNNNYSRLSWNDSDYIYFFENPSNSSKTLYDVIRTSMLTGDSEVVYSIYDSYVKSCDGSLYQDNMAILAPARIGNNLLFKDKDSLVLFDVAKKKTIWSIKLGYMLEMYEDPPIRIFKRGRKTVATITGYIFYDANNDGCYKQPKEGYIYPESEEEKAKYAYTYIIDLKDGSVIKKFPFFSFTISSDDNSLYLIESRDFDNKNGFNKTTIKVIDPFNGNMVRDIDL